MIIIDILGEDEEIIFKCSDDKIDSKNINLRKLLGDELQLQVIEII